MNHETKTQIAMDYVHLIKTCKDDAMMLDTLLALIDKVELISLHPMSTCPKCGLFRCECEKGGEGGC